MKCNSSNFQLRCEKAIEFALQYGSFDGEHHKQWALDQIIRILCGNLNNYKKRLKQWNSDEEYDPWDEGIPP